MAKRKKKSGGGGFGGGAKPGPRRMHDFGGPPLDFTMSARSSDQSMKLIQKAILSQGIQTPEELGKFLNERMIGRPLDDLAAEFAGEGPKSELDRAEELMDGLAEDASSVQIRRTAGKALEISPYCLSAWLALGVDEDDPAKALEYFDQGIEKGRSRFDALIGSLEEGQGLWGWIEARDFMRLQHQRALVLEVLGDFEQAVEAYEEMHTLNPGDNQGVRGDLLRLLMVFRRIDDARALVNRFPDDADVAMVYGRAFLSFVETMDRTGFDLTDLKDAGAPIPPPAAVKRLGREFDDAKKQLRRAVKMNPFVPWIMTHPQLMEAEAADMVAYGGAAEALVYSQKWAVVWFAAALPFIAMTASMGSDPLRLAKTDFMREELLEILGQLESSHGIPWWEDFDSGES
jgi:tetratricopeptide (TPR) repeat protein